MASYVDLLTIHNPATGTAPPATWGDQIRENETYLYERGPYICTAATHPGSPFEGQVIYETDTDKYFSYSGAAWVQMLATGAWTSWTPNIVQWGIGNGTVTGSYQKVGRMVTVRGTYTTGSSSSYASNLIITGLPFAAAAAQWAYGGNMTDSSAGVLTPAAWRIGSFSTTAIEPFAWTAVNQLNNAGITSTVPWTWATGDSLQWGFTYEATS